MRDKLNVNIEIKKGVTESIRVSFQGSLVFWFFKKYSRKITLPAWLFSVLA